MTKLRIHYFVVSIKTVLTVDFPLSNRKNITLKKYITCLTLKYLENSKLLLAYVKVCKVFVALVSNIVIMFESECYVKCCCGVLIRTLCKHLSTEHARRIYFS